MGRKKKYNTEEERKLALSNYHKQWRIDNPDYYKKYYQKNKVGLKLYMKEYMKKYIAKYRETPVGRANYLVDNYQRKDIEYDRGECTLTADWVLENILSKTCHYCGETDWKKLGCDRIDNNLPHTPDNVVPCCYHCNCKKGTTSYKEYIKMLGEK